MRRYNVTEWDRNIKNMRKKKKLIWYVKTMLATTEIRFVISRYLWSVVSTSLNSNTNIINEVELFCSTPGRLDFCACPHSRLD